MIREDYGFWKFRKLEFSHLYAAFILNGHSSLVEDCYFHDVFRDTIFLHGRLNTLRRLSFNRCGFATGARIIGNAFWDNKYGHD